MKTNRYRLRRRITKLVLLGAFGYGMYALSGVIDRIPEIHIHQIDIRGCHYAPPAQVRAFASTYNGHNMITTWLSGRLKHRLLNRFGQIEHVKITPHFPSRLSIVVQEKKPYALFVTPKAQVLSARDGSCLRVYPTTKSLTTDRMVTGLLHPYVYPKVHPVVLSKLATLDTALRPYADLWPLTISYRRLLVIPSTQYDEVVLLKEHTVPIRISMDNVSEQLSGLALFFKQQRPSDNRRIRYINARIGHRIIVSYVP
jgi:POTRA domain, FtsQ-type